MKKLFKFLKSLFVKQNVIEQKVETAAKTDVVVESKPKVKKATNSKSSVDKMAAVKPVKKVKEVKATVKSKKSEK